jgi:hypothetical protein
MHFLTPLFVASALAVSGMAQLTVTATGRVERAPANPCNAAGTHRLACTEILLHSSTVNLAQFEGRMVDVTGTSEGTLLCPLVNVSEAVAAPQSTTTFSLGGYRLNSTVIWTTTAPAGAVVPYFFSFEPSFLPIANFGTLQLSLVGFVYWSMDVSIGVAVRTVRIPNEPGLIGVRMLFQTAFAAVLPELQFKLLNAGCFVIQQ